MKIEFPVISCTFSQNSPLHSNSDVDFYRQIGFFSSPSCTKSKPIASESLVTRLFKISPSYVESL